MTLPGLALFYSGMVRKKNMLATMAQSVAATVHRVDSVVRRSATAWLSRGDDAWIGGLGAHFHARDRRSNTISPFAKTIPEMLFMAYQMTFAVITCALVGGAVADRMKFSAFLPVLRAVAVRRLCADGPLGVGRRFSRRPWIDRFRRRHGGPHQRRRRRPRRRADGGRAAGLRHARTSHLSICRWRSSAPACCGSVGSASTAVRRWLRARAPYSPSSRRILSACAGALVWSGIEWLKRGKPSVLGLISGAVAGLGTITPGLGLRPALAGRRHRRASPAASATGPAPR